MAGYRMAQPTLKSAGRARVTCIRDIIKEVEEDESRASTCPDSNTSGSGTPRSLHSDNGGTGIYNDANKGQNGINRNIVVRIPSATTSDKVNRKQDMKRSRRMSTNGRGDDVISHEHQSQNNQCTSNTSTPHVKVGPKSKKSPGPSCKQPDQSSPKNQRTMSEIDACPSMDDAQTTVVDLLEKRKQSLNTNGGHDTDTESLSNSEARTEYDWDFGCDMNGMHFLPKLMTERGSNDFHNVMSEMKTEMKNSKVRREGFKKAIRIGMMLKGMGQRRASARVPIGEEDNSEDDTEEEDVIEAIQPKERDLRRMSRGWKILNNLVQEERLQKKKQETTGGWNFLKNAIAHMTDEEKARQELYDRYLHRPNSWADGLVNYPKFLQDRQGNLNSKLSVTVTSHNRTRPHTAYASSHPLRSGHVNIKTNGVNRVRHPDPKQTFLLQRPKSGYV